MFTQFSLLNIQVFFVVVLFVLFIILVQPDVSSIDYRANLPNKFHVSGFYCGGWRSTGVSTQGSTLPFEPLHQPFFMLDIFEIGPHKLLCLGWPQTVILLISSS
jgi:hypothetical protein